MPKQHIKKQALSADLVDDGQTLHIPLTIVQPVMLIITKSTPCSDDIFCVKRNYRVRASAGVADEYGGVTSHSTSIKLAADEYREDL
jgi:hypothetical protein